MNPPPSSDVPHGLSRRGFLQSAVGTGGGILLARRAGAAPVKTSSAGDAPPGGEPDHTIRIATGLVELAPEKIVSTTLYNDQFPGPLLRLKEGQRVVVDIHNDTDTPELFHWHGQFLPPEVDGAAEEGTPFIPPHGSRRIAFVPGPAGFRFYHTHLRSGGDLNVGQYTGQAGPVYIEPKREPGNYDREVFLVLKEFAPVFSKGGDMAADFLAPDSRVRELERAGEEPMKESLANGAAHGYEVGYQLFSINGTAFSMEKGRPLSCRPLFKIREGRRYRLRMRNASDDIHPMHLHRHSFELTKIAGRATAGILKDVVMLGGYQEMEVDFTADNPGLTLFHCHSQLHMDFGFMALFGEAADGSYFKNRGGLHPSESGQVGLGRRGLRQETEELAIAQFRKLCGEQGSCLLFGTPVTGL